MTESPTPGSPVRGSRTGRPIMAALDLLGQRWVLRILWELRQGPLTFRGLQDACEGPSPSVLNTRLKVMRQAKLLAHDHGCGYCLTQEGEDLMKALFPLISWSENWAKTMTK